MSRFPARVGLVIGLLLVSLAPTAGHVAESTPTAWMKRNARPFDTCTPSERVSDLSDLRKIVGNARIVALGEGTHGTREFFQLKHRITQYLATEMGFTVFAIEANLPEAWRINDYVLGGDGDPRALINGMYFWTWKTEEVLEMVEWMRRFNASKRGRIEFTGFDMQTPDTAAAIVRRYLATHDPAWAESISTALSPRDPGFVSATGTLPATAFAGHTVRYSGFIRTDGVSRFAGLWMRADSSGKRAIAFNNMQSQTVNGTRGWKRYEIQLAIPAGADSVKFGVLMSGEGTAWFDSLAVELDGAPWTSNSIDLALEAADGPRGFNRRPPHPRFSIAMDGTTAASGSRSLRLSGTPASPSGPEVASAQRLVDHLEASRGRLGAATTPAQADWIIRNAHVVLQSAQSKAGATSLVRDSSMAANVVWIAEEARKGSKVVLWAHNGHVAKNPGWMGKWLADRYGKDLVVVGFAANEGTYTAMGDRALRSDNVLVPGPAGSIESFAHDTGLPRFLLDLREADKEPEMAKILRSRLLMRSIGAMAMDIQFDYTAILNSYDVLAWVDHTEASRQLPPISTPRYP